MSTDEPQVPPAGEEIHLPPGSFQPLAMTVGITLTLLGLTSTVYLMIAGIIIFLWSLALWIRDARNEYLHLPEHHGHDDAAHAVADDAAPEAGAEAAH